MYARRNVEGAVFVGTSGFYYEGWKGKFYPENLAKKKMLEYYSTRFNTVELNSTFYRLPSEKTVKGWKDRVGGDFVFAVKGSRYITHRLKLRDAAGSLSLMFERFRLFGSKLGVVLFQLPPSLKSDPGLLESFLSQLKKGHRYAVEFRHESWFVDRTFEILRKFNAALCIESHPRLPEIFEVTADFIYVRFHGKPQLYTSNYSDKELSRWAERIASLAGGKRDIYCYFNNDVDGHAAANALRLRELLETV